MSLQLDLMPKMKITLFVEKYENVDLDVFNFYRLLRGLNDMLSVDYLYYFVCIRWYLLLNLKTSLKTLTHDALLVR